MINFNICNRETKKLIIKNRTNEGDQAKQYFNTYGTCPEDASLVTCKYILNEKKRMPMMQAVKTFKGLTLHQQFYGLRIKTLEQVINYFTNEEAITTTQFEGDTYSYEYKLAKDGDMCLATNDPQVYCNGLYKYSSKDPGNGKAFVVTEIFKRTK